MKRFCSASRVAWLFTLVSASSSAIAQGEPTAMVLAPCAGLAHEDSAAKRTRDWGDLCHYASDNKTLSARPRVVFIGDSITAGWQKGDPSIFSPVALDRGISGQTSAQMLVRFYADVVALHPAEVHIMAGTNDVAGNTGPTSQEAFQNNIRAMSDLARANRIRVIIGAIPPASRFWWAPDLRPAVQIKTLNLWLRSFARQNGYRFVDYWSVMSTADGAMRSDLSDDGVHPNAAGYRVMRPLALAATRSTWPERYVRHMEH